MKKKTEIISNRQLWFILFMMRSIVIVSFLPILTSADALQDAWISALVALIGSEIFVLLISLLCIKFPDLTVIEFSPKLLGTLGGKLLGLVFLWLFLQLSVVNIRIYSEVIVTGFMPQTPEIVIIGSMVVVAVICVYCGIETLGRAADFLFFIFILMVLSVILIPLPDFKIENIQPIFARGWGPVIRGSITPVALIVQVWVLGILSPYTLEPRKNVIISLTATGTSILILVLVGLITAGVLGPYEGARSNFPVLTLMRSVELSKFLQRTESLIMLGWGVGLFISVATFLYCGARGMSQWLNISDYRSLVFPMAVIWVFLAVQGFENIFALYTFLSPAVFGPFGFSLLVIPLLLLWSGYGIRSLIKRFRSNQ